MPGKPIFDAPLLEKALADAAIEYECQSENSPNSADPMKREILDAVKRWYQYDWLAIKNKHDVVPAEAGTHVLWIPAFAGMTRFWGMTGLGGHLGFPFPVRRQSAGEKRTFCASLRNATTRSSMPMGDTLCPLAALLEMRSTVVLSPFASLRVNCAKDHCGWFCFRQLR